MTSTKSAVYPQFFDPRRLGESLREVSSDLLNLESQKLVSRWFHAPSDVDFFIWTDERKHIVKQQLAFFGQVVEWNVVEGTRTGVIIDGDEDEESEPMNPSDTIHFDSITQPQPLGQAMELIRHMPALKETEQEEIIRNFFKGQRHKTPQQPAVLHDLFGPEVDWDPPTLMHRLKNLFALLFKRR